MVWQINAAPGMSSCPPGLDFSKSKNSCVEVVESDGECPGWLKLAMMVGEVAQAASGSQSRLNTFEE